MTALTAHNLFYGREAANGKECLNLLIIRAGCQSERCRAKRSRRTNTHNSVINSISPFTISSA